MKEIVILGGPNGAGKTTAAQFVLADKLAITEFVNADEIARGLSPFDPEGVALQAGKIMLARMAELAEKKESFAFETTCAGRSYSRLLESCKKDGYQIHLLYLWLPSPEVAIARVAKRVQKGGHRVPDDIVVRRYWGGLTNLRELYLPMADNAAVYDNTDGNRVLVVQKVPERGLIVYDEARWQRIVSMSS